MTIPNKIPTGDHENRIRSLELAVAYLQRDINILTGEVETNMEGYKTQKKAISVSRIKHQALLNPRLTK